MKKICIVASKYYEDIINMLISGANDVLNNHKKKLKQRLFMFQVFSKYHMRYQKI